eukprot:Skav222317  [mRNA]  locus=scaffold1249:220947:222023:- [translate_table: standard]
MTTSRSQIRPPKHGFLSGHVNTFFGEGEGWGFAMEAPGTVGCVQTDSFPIPFEILAPTVNTHGILSPASFGSPILNWRSSKTTLKRSIYRAYRRALQDGCTWFRGAMMIPKDFENLFHLDRPCSSPARPRDPLERSQVGQHRPRNRAQVLSWNPGGLSDVRYWEVMHWIGLLAPDIVIISETRWRFNRQWSHRQWHCLHSAGDDGAAGLLVLINRRLADQSQLLWDEPLPGRLVHLRLLGPGQPLDIVAGYQYAWQPGEHRARQRSTWWQQADRVLRTCSKRNQLLFAGDLNCAIPALPGRVGCSQFSTASGHHSGFQHPDSHRFKELLEQHDLLVLNSWDPSAPPTFCQHSHSSRIV